MAACSDRKTIEDLLVEVRRFFWPVLIFSIVINLMTLILPIYMLQIYDRVLTSRNITTLILITVVALGMLAVGNLMSHYRSLVTARLGAYFFQEMSQLTFGIIAGKPLDSKSPRRLVKHVECIHEFVAGGNMIKLFDAPWTPIFLFVLFLLHPVVGLVASFFVVALLLLGCLAVWSAGKKTKSYKDTRTKADQSLKQCHDAQDVIWSMGMARPIVAQWQERQFDALADQSSVSDQRSSHKALRQFLQHAGQMTIIGTGAYLAIHGQITPGAIVAGSIICIRALQPIDGTIRALSEIRSVYAAYASLRDFVGSNKSSAKSSIIPSSPGALEVEDLAVDLGRGKKTSIRSLEFNLDAGESISIVGPTGTGKSLLAQTLAGVRRPAAGSVLLNGVDLHRVSADRLGVLIGYVSQRPALFDGTVGQNISRFREGHSEELDLATDSAGIRDTLLSLPDAYETPMKEALKVLSPIHIRFMTLARALYGMPPLLIIDQIDTGLDKAWIDVVNDVMRITQAVRQTTIWITDRPRMIQQTNHVVVLSQRNVEFLRNSRRLKA